MQVRLKVTPNAKTNAILGWEEDSRASRVLRIRIQAPPIDGKANKALLAFLSKEWGVPKSRLSIVRGETNRLKVVDVPDETKLPQ